MAPVVKDPSIIERLTPWLASVAECQSVNTRHMSLFYSFSVLFLLYFLFTLSYFLIARKGYIFYSQLN